jgi:uncharacterized protein YuzE
MPSIYMDILYVYLTFPNLKVIEQTIKTSILYITPSYFDLLFIFQQCHDTEEDLWIPIDQIGRTCAQSLFLKEYLNFTRYMNTGSRHSTFSLVGW